MWIIVMGGGGAYKTDFKPVIRNKNLKKKYLPSNIKISRKKYAYLTNILEKRETLLPQVYISSGKSNNKYKGM